MQLILKVDTFGARATVSIMHHTDSINNVMANISVLLPFDMVNPSTINIDSNETILELLE